MLFDSFHSSLLEEDKWVFDHVRPGIDALLSKTALQQQLLFRILLPMPT
jgi:hypothetical protein